MRVITGSARGRALKTVEGLEVRPTAAVVKESVFNIIQFEVPCTRVLDLFCGSGQIGIEALSRGAASCVFVDKGQSSLRCTKENLEHTKLTENARVVASDAALFLQYTCEVFDLAFLDPPYEKGLLEQVMPLLIRRMSPNGIIICEHSAKETLPERYGAFGKVKDYRYGRIVLSVYRAQDKESAENGVRL